MRYHWFLLPSIFLSVKGSSSPERGREEENVNNNTFIILPTMQGTESTESTQSVIPLGQPSQTSDDFGPERAPSFGQNDLRELGILSGQSSPKQKVIPYKFVSIEKFRADNLLEQYHNKPEDLLMRLDFEAIKTMFEHEPEYMFLVDKIESQALLNIFGSLEKISAELVDVSLDFLDFIFRVLDHAGVLQPDALLLYYSHFSKEFRSIEHLRDCIPMLTPIQANLDMKFKRTFLSGIQFDAHNLVTDEQFYNWNLSSWLFEKKLVIMLNSHREIACYKHLLDKVKLIRKNMRDLLDFEGKPHWNKAFDVLESGLQDLNVAELANEWYGLSWEAQKREIFYDNVFSSERIKVRFLMYLCILSPKVEDNKALLSLLVAKVARFPGSHDMNEHEICFLYELCIEFPQLGSLVLAHYHISRPYSSMSQLIKENLSIDTLNTFEDPVAFIQLAVSHEPNWRGCNSEMIFSLRHHQEVLKNRFLEQVNDIREESVDIQEDEQETLFESPEIEEGPFVGRKRSAEQASNQTHKRQATNYELDHYLTDAQMDRMPGEISVSNVYFVKKIRLTRPDPQYLNNRVDHFLQNFTDSDSKSIIDPQMDDEIKLFVQGAFVLVQQLLVHDISNVNVEWLNSVSLGQGLAVEALNFLGKACVLPFLELLHYDKVLKGFVPFPLLAPEMMALLGGLVGLLIKYDFPADWYFAPEYARFLFYSESYDESVADQATQIYSSIFKNLDELAGAYSHTDLLDYLPTTFASHYPFQVKYNESFLEARPFNLYSYGSRPESNPFLRIDRLMNKRTLNLLQASLYAPAEESKSGEVYIAESKDSEPNESMDLKRLQARTALFAIVKPILAAEIALRMKQGRFAFQRSFLRNFSQVFWPIIDYKRMMRFWSVERIPFTFEDFADGFEFPEKTRLTTEMDEEDGRTIPAREAFYQILASCSSADLKSFYNYATGISHLPTRGLHSDPIIIRFLDNLMTRSHTCFRICDVGVYPKFSLMKKLFFISIYESENNLEGENRYSSRSVVPIAEVVVNVNVEPGTIAETEGVPTNNEQNAPVV